MRQGILIFAMLLSVRSALADAEIFPQGFVDSVHAVQVQDDHNFLNSKTRARLGLEVQGDNSALKIFADAVYNTVIKSQSGVGLYEAYGEYYTDFWDIRVGRQLLVWGKADGLRITDLLCPTDYTEFIALEFDDVRIPINALRLRFLSDTVSFEMVSIPIFTPGVMPPEDSPYNTTTAQLDALGLELDNPSLPEKTIENMESAARISFYLPHIDFAVSALYLWDDFPTLRIETIEDQAVVTQHYHRFFALGAEFSVPLGDFVFRGEAAAYFDRYLQHADMSAASKTDMLNYLLGVDWYPGDNWTIMLQASSASILGDGSLLEQRKHTIVSTLLMQKKLLREKLTLSNMTYMGFIDWDVFNRTSVEYALSDAFHIYIGFDLFAGDKEGTFGQYSDLSSVWLKAKYSF
jgi:hypothetical protein